MLINRFEVILLLLATINANAQEISPKIPFSDNLLQKAESGDPQAQAEISRTYLSGINVKIDENNGFKWAKESAEKGNPFGQLCLGNCYLEGKGVDKNPDMAFEYYKRSDGQGYLDATYNLGLYTEKGHFEKKGIDNALPYYEKCVLKGDFVTARYLGDLFSIGNRETNDIPRAINYYNKVTDKENLDTKRGLEYLYKNGFVTTNYVNEAIESYKKTAEENYAYAANRLGNIYFEGIGIEKDLLKAFYWFEKAAQGGDAEGQYGYGYCYENGLGTSKKPNEASQWYQKAAKRNCGKAQYALGNIYYSENKFTKAKSLYEKAKKNKVILASEGLLMAKKNISQEGLFRGIYNLKWWGVLILIVTLLSYLSGWIFVFGIFEHTNQAKVIAFVFGVFGIVNLFIGPLIFIKMLKVFENPMGLIAYGLAVALFLSGWLNAFSKKQIFKRLSYLFLLLGGCLLSGLIAIILYLIGNIFLDVFHGPSLFQCFFLTAVFSFGVLGMVRIGKKEETIQTWKNLCVLASISGFVCAFSAAVFLNEYYLSADSSKTDRLVYCLIHVLLPTGLLISWKHFNPTARKASYLLCCIWIALISFRILQLVSVERSANDYLESLTLIQKGEQLSKENNIQEAKVAFQSAYETISNISRQKIEWETELVKYRLDDLNKKIMALDSQSSTNPQQNP
jgi:TPR repeat protein